MFIELSTCTWAFRRNIFVTISLEILPSTRRQKPTTTPEPETALTAPFFLPFIFPFPSVFSSAIRRLIAFRKAVIVVKIIVNIVYHQRCIVRRAVQTCFFFGACPRVSLVSELLVTIGIKIIKRYFFIRHFDGRSGQIIDSIDI